jgi:hypothetical protein
MLIVIIAILLFLYLLINKYRNKSQNKINYSRHNYEGGSGIHVDGRQSGNKFGGCLSRNHNSPTERDKCVNKFCGRDASKNGDEECCGPEDSSISCKNWCKNVNNKPKYDGRDGCCADYGEACREYCKNSTNPQDGEKCCRYEEFKYCDEYCETPGVNQKPCCKWKNKCKKYCKDTENLDKYLCCADCDDREKCNREGVQKYSPTKSDGCGVYCKRDDSDGDICCGNPSSLYSEQMHDSKPCRDYCRNGKDGTRTAKYCCGDNNHADQRKWSACGDYCKRDDADTTYCA